MTLPDERRAGGPQWERPGLRARWLRLRLHLASGPDAARCRPARRGAGRRRASRQSAPSFPPTASGSGIMDGARVMKVPLAGGAPVTICDSCTGYSFSWGSDDTVRYHTAPASNPNSRVLMAVSARGGTPYEIARPDTSSTEAFRGPMLVPGTRTVLFALFTGSGSRLAALNLDTHAITRFDQPGFSPQWVAAGFVTLGSSDGSLIALPFDAKRGRPSGPPVTITRDVSQPDAFVSRAAVSASGAIVYPQSGGDSPRRLALVGRSGSVNLIPGEARLFASSSFLPGWTPPGTRDHRPDGGEGRLGLRCRATHLVAPHDQRDQQSPRLDARWPSSGLLQQRRPLVDRRRRQRPSREPARRQRQPFRGDGHPRRTCRGVPGSGERSQRDSEHGLRFGSRVAPS